jgi:hypothetical protein
LTLFDLQLAQVGFGQFDQLAALADLGEVSVVVAQVAADLRAGGRSAVGGAA